MGNLFYKTRPMLNVECPLAMLFIGVRGFFSL